MRQAVQLSTREFRQHLKPSKYHHVHSKLAAPPAAHAGTEEKLQTRSTLRWFRGDRKIVELKASLPQPEQAQ